MAVTVWLLSVQTQKVATPVPVLLDLYYSWTESPAKVNMVLLMTAYRDVT